MADWATSPGFAWLDASARRGAELERGFSDAIHAAGDLVARLDRADAGRRARENQIARLQRDRLRHVTDYVGDRPDHFGEIALLTHFAVHRQPDAALARMAGLRDRTQRRDRAGRVETLRPVPRTALFLRDDLQVAARQVDADAVAPDVIERLVRRNRLTGLADRDDQFDLVLHIRSQRRIRDDAARGDDRVSGLREEEWRVAVPVRAHFPRVVGVSCGAAEPPPRRGAA